MTIHHQIIDENEALSIVDIDSAVPKGIISKPVCDLLKTPALVDISGAFTTDDNYPCDSKEFERTFPQKHPLVHGFVKRMEPYMDTKPLIKMLSGGRNAMVSGNFRMAHSLLGYSATMSPEVFVVSHPKMDDCIRDCLYQDEHPKDYFSDHALGVMTHFLGPYLADGLHCEKAKDGKWAIKGKKHSVDDVLKATKNFSMMGNSYGSIFIFQCENALKHMLCELKYSPQEVQEIMVSVRAMAVSVLSDFGDLKNTPAHPDPRFTMIGIEGLNDVVSHILNPNKGAGLTPDEIHKWVPPAIQEKVWNEQLKYERFVEENLADFGVTHHPSFEQSAEIKKNPEPVFIVRKIAPNRIHILTTVPTYAEQWVFDLPNRHAKKYVEALNGLYKSVKPGDGKKLTSLLREGGKEAEQQLETLLLQEKKDPDTTTCITKWLDIARKGREEFEGYVRILGFDRAGHSVIFYFLPNHPLSHLCQRIVQNGMRYSYMSEDKQKAFNVESMLSPVLETSPRGVSRHTGYFLGPHDEELGEWLGPQLKALRETAGKSEARVR